MCGLSLLAAVGPSMPIIGGGRRHHARAVGRLGNVKMVVTNKEKRMKYI